MDFESKFLEFMRRWVVSTNCSYPTIEWAKFIGMNFPKDEYEKAQAYIEYLVEEHYIKLVDSDRGPCYAITGYGYEMVKRGIMP